MNITRRPDLEVLVKDEMRRTFDARALDEPLHVSDLLNPRWAYFQRVMPRPITDDELGYFIAGRGHEDALWRLHGYQQGEQRIAYGISFRPDFYTSIPIEFKTRRRKLAEEGQEATAYDTYIEQARGYAALTNQPAAWLWILSLLERQEDGSTKPEFRCYLIEWTREEIEAARADLERRRDLLAAALRDKDHRALPLCWPFKCGKASRVLVKKPKCLTCDREFEGEWGINKHLESRTGAGHVTQGPEYERRYEPKCRWYRECAPWTDDPERGESPRGTERPR